MLAMALSLLSAPAKAQEPVTVGTALVLAMDVSASVDTAEYDLQKRGVAQAFRDPAVVRAIWNQPYGRMAVAVVEWSDSARVVVPWTIVDDAASAERLSGAVDAVQRTSMGSTGLGRGIAFALEVLDACPCVPARRVIDVSGDGRSNDGIPAGKARDHAVELGVVVNGLAIVDASEPDLVSWYEENVRGGLGAFVIEARGFQDFARAIRHKLVLEIVQHMPVDSFDLPPPG